METSAFAKTPAILEKRCISFVWYLPADLSNKEGYVNIALEIINTYKLSPLQKEGRHT